MYMRTALTLATFLPCLALHAQPPNDACADAALLCSQQPQGGTNINSQGGSGFCGASDIVWYTFTTNSQGGPVTVEVTGMNCLTIPGMGDELVVVVMSGNASCNLASFEGVNSGGCNNASGAGDFVVTTNALDPNTQYWITVGGTMGTTQAAQCTFTLNVSGPGADVVGVDFGAGPDVTIGLGESAQLTAFGGPPYTWSPTSGLSGSTIADPIASPESTTFYEVSTTINGCDYTDTVIVEVVRRVDPPNTFTPNNDGYNDLWLIPGIADYPGAEVVVHDRWGQRVFRSVGYREPWDGTNNGKDVPNGTYYYRIRLNQLEGRSAPYTGFISIVR